MPNNKLFSFFTNHYNSHSKDPLYTDPRVRKNKKKSNKDRSQGSPRGVAPSVRPRESSLYCNNFAASVSCLPSHFDSRFDSSTYLPESAHYKSHNYTTLDLRYSSGHSHSPIQFNKDLEISYPSSSNRDTLFSLASSDYQSDSAHCNSYHSHYNATSPVPSSSIRGLELEVESLETSNQRITPTLTETLQERRITSISPNKNKLKSKSVISLVWNKMNNNKDKDGSRSSSNTSSKFNLSENWSTGYIEADMLPPPIPTRSHLRPSPHIAPPPTTERRSSLGGYKLAVDPPLSPSLYSGSSEDGESSSPPPLKSPAIIEFGFKKRRAEMRTSGGDPLKIRDGAPPKESTSGVYTPPTFPGAQGPRPSHFPTHVYTPTNFSLYPTQPPPQISSSSRSSSLSSTTSNSNSDSYPQTPTTPSYSPRGWSGLSTGIRRISSSIAHLDPRSSHHSSHGSHLSTNNISPPMPTSIASTPRQYSNPVTPASAGRESYFPKHSHTRSTSWNSTTTNNTAASATGPEWMRMPTGNNGLGIVGVREDPRQSLGVRMRDLVQSPGSTISEVSNSTGTVSKGRRKPVPKVDELEVEVQRIRIADQDDEEFTHAL